MGRADPASNRRKKRLSFPRRAIPLSLYVHIPWCLRKCPYCDFNSHALLAEGLPLSHHQALPLEAPYLDALCRDLEQELPFVAGREVATFFIGGGTPSLLSCAGLDRLLTSLRDRLPISASAEVTLEANPGAVDVERFAGFKAAGVNRLSLGIQSFNDASLSRLGRIHNRAEAIAAFALARRVGYDNINLDLMFGLPGQDLVGAKADLAAALALAPEHISYYQLGIEPETAFYRRPPQLPDEETCLAMQAQGVAMLAAAGFVQYEVSAYAQPNRQCQHNRNYWEFGDYLGIGAGAHGKITGAEGVRRRAKYQNPRTYIEGIQANGAYLADEEWVSPSDLPVEFMLNALRLVEGVPSALYAERTGLSLSRISDKLALSRTRGWLDPREDRLVATKTGRQFLNNLLELFLPDDADQA